VDRALRAIRHDRAALDADEARWLREAEAQQSTMRPRDLRNLTAARSKRTWSRDQGRAPTTPRPLARSA